MGSDVRLADPAELYPPKDVTDAANDIAARTGARITITDDPGDSHRCMKMSTWPTAQVPAYLIDTMRVSPVRPEPQASTHDRPLLHASGVVDAEDIPTSPPERNARMAQLGSL